MTRIFSQLLRLAAASLGCSAVGAALMGCTKVEATKTFTISDVTYTFPTDHVDAVTKPQEERPYARIVSPGAKYILVYSKNIERPNQQGTGIPTIVYINDVPGRNIQIIRTPEGAVLCEPGLREYNCGLSLKDSGVNWNVLFNQRALSEIAGIREEAAALLKRYRS